MARSTYIFPWDGLLKRDAYNTPAVLNYVGGGSGNGSSLEVKTIDLNTYIEYLGPQGSGVYNVVNGQTFGLTNDGTHPNSYGNFIMSQALAGF